MKGKTDGEPTPDVAATHRAAGSPCTAIAKTVGFHISGAAETRAGSGGGQVRVRAMRESLQKQYHDLRRRSVRREMVLRLLDEHRTDLERFGVRSLSLFGSVARDESTAPSDVDILVDFGAPTTFEQYMDVKLFLEGLLGVRVDLVTERGLKARVRPYVERDAIRVA